MHLAQILEQHHPSVSFEFFPPKSDDAAERLFREVEQLESLRPSFVTVTDGAGGSTRERTRQLVIRLTQQTGITTIPHLTCVGISRDEIGRVLQEYVDNGVENVLALRGDPPTDAESFQPDPNGFTYATELVAFIKQHFPQLGIGVAGYPEGHPETPDRLAELRHLKEKVDAGADVIITQLFFDNHDFYDFISRCDLEGITSPIVAGVMPIQSIKGARRMAGMCGARIPAPLLKSLKRTKDDPQAVKHVGTHWASEQCRDLFDQDVRGIHLYTLNHSQSTRQIYESLGIKHSEALRD